MGDNIFFSIVIPTYNPRAYLPRLLESITHNNCLDKIEVVISDDCSTEQFDDILDNFPQLQFQKIQNKFHSGFPRNGRQHGIEVANGKWVCFADQDDYFFDNAFDKMIQFIDDTKATNHIITNFVEESVETGKKILRDMNSGWTHGKLYEKSFWIDNGIKYDEIEYCEDINLTTIIDCIATVNHIKVYECKQPIYVWMRRKDSLSDINYFKKSMPDYIRATSGVIMRYIEKYIKYGYTVALLNAKFIITIFHVYFYYQSKQLSESKQELIRSINTLQPIYTKFKETTGLTNEKILDCITSDLIALYNETRYNDCKQIPFIEQITFKDWMHMYLD